MVAAVTGLGRVYLCRFEDGPESEIAAADAEAALDTFVMSRLLEWGLLGEEPRDGTATAMLEDGSEEASRVLDFEGWGL